MIAGVITVVALSFAVAGYIGVFDRDSEFRKVTGFLLGTRKRPLYLSPDRCRVCEKDVNVVGMGVPLGPGARACATCYRDHILPDLEALVFEKALAMEAPEEKKPVAVAEIVRRLEAASGGAGGGGRFVSVIEQQYQNPVKPVVVNSMLCMCLNCEKGAKRQPFMEAKEQNADSIPLPADHYSYKGGHCPCGCTKTGGMGHVVKK